MLGVRPDGVAIVPSITYRSPKRVFSILATSWSAACFSKAARTSDSHGLGLFVRSLVGLDREAAKQAFAGFLTSKKFGANQIEFVNLIVDHLTEHGVMGAALLYESPFTDLTPRGPEELFSAAQLDELLAVLDRVRDAALAA